jgi:signal transduction histidine kinase
VADTGEGIAPDDLPHVFDRFYRADPSRSRSTGGAGLGLSIVRELVELMGGTVTAESALDGGSTFTVSLPVILPDGVPPNCAI